MESTESNAPPAVQCPGCAAPNDVTLTSSPQIATCAQCGLAFVVPAADGSAPAVARVGNEPDEFVHDDSATADNLPDDLDALRIRQVTALKRTAYRTRSYLLIVTVICVVASARLLWIGMDWYQTSGWKWQPLACLAAAIVLFIVARKTWAKSVHYKHEADRPAQTDPATPPDFSTLSDGSQRWKNLEKIDE